LNGKEQTENKEIELNYGIFFKTTEALRALRATKL